MFQRGGAVEGGVGETAGRPQQPETHVLRTQGKDRERERERVKEKKETDRETERQGGEI